MRRFRTTKELEEIIQATSAVVRELQDEVDDALQRGHDECTRGVLDWLWLVMGGMTPVEATGIVERRHDLDREMIDAMHRFHMPNPKLELPKPAPKPKRKK